MKTKEQGQFFYCLVWYKNSHFFLSKKFYNTEKVGANNQNRQAHSGQTINNNIKKVCPHILQPALADMSLKVPTKKRFESEGLFDL